MKLGGARERCSDATGEKIPDVCAYKDYRSRFNIDLCYSPLPDSIRRTHIPVRDAGLKYKPLERGPPPE